jgi:hypothetical protein
MKQRDEVLGVKIMGGLPEASTPWAGDSLPVELFRRSGMDELANKVLPAKQRGSLHPTYPGHQFWRLPILYRGYSPFSQFSEFIVRKLSCIVLSHALIVLY